MRESTRQRARASIGFAIMGIAFAALAVAGAAITVRLNEPVRTVAIVGDLNAEQRAQVSRAVSTFSSRGLVRLDEAGLERAVSSIDWTQTVRVRRVWPDRLEVSVQAEVPVARWGVDRLLSSQGKIITGDIGQAADLPRLDGPEGSAVLMIERFSLAREMAARLGLRIKKLVLDDVRGWSMVFDNGLELVLGRDDAIARMKRFQKLYEARLSMDAKRIARADARYPNGVAVTFRADAPAAPGLGLPVAIATHDGG